MFSLFYDKQILKSNFKLNNTNLNFSFLKLLISLLNRLTYDGEIFILKILRISFAISCEELNPFFLIVESCDINKVFIIIIYCIGK